MSVKNIVDLGLDCLRAVEETLHPGTATVLDRFKRSVQLDDYSCGAQSAYAILRYYGKARSPQAIARILKVKADGVSQGPILALFRQRGLRPVIKPRATVRDIERAIRVGAPVLASVDANQHWVTVYGYSKTHIFVADPTLWAPFCIVPRKAFLRRWDRWAMVVPK